MIISLEVVNLEQSLVLIVLALPNLVNLGIIITAHKAVIHCVIKSINLLSSIATHIWPSVAVNKLLF